MAQQGANAYEEIGAAEDVSIKTEDVQDSSICGGGTSEGEASATTENIRKENDKFINLKVFQHDALGSIHYKLKMNTLLGKLKKSYCMLKDSEPQHLRFIYDGVRIKDSDTPVDLEMEDGDVIDVYEEQMGGIRS